MSTQLPSRVPMSAFELIDGLMQASFQSFESYTSLGGRKRLRISFRGLSVQVEKAVKLEEVYSNIAMPIRYQRYSLLIVYVWNEGIKAHFT